MHRSHIVSNISLGALGGAVSVASGRHPVVRPFAVHSVLRELRSAEKEIC